MPRVCEDQKPPSGLGIAREAHSKSAPQRTWNRQGDRLHVLARGWASLAGLVTVALIARFLSPAEQGYYYTFGSLIALQIVFELGFSFVILQMASHERAHLTLSPRRSISGDAVAHARLASVLQKDDPLVHRCGISFWRYFYLLRARIFFPRTSMRATSFLAFPVVCGRVRGDAHFSTGSNSLLYGRMRICGERRASQIRPGRRPASTLAWMSLATHHGLFAPAMIIVGNAGVASIWLFGSGDYCSPLLRHNPA